MATGYTSLLGLALPVTGELSGTWGTTVNDYITQFVDAAVAGTQTISGSQTAVTLSKTEGTSLSSAGSGSTGSSQYAVINCTGNPAGMLTITAPATSKTYVLINATSTTQSVKIVGAGPTTGVTAVSGEKCVVAWNGSDFVKVASTVTAASGLSGTVAVANGGTGQTSYTDGQLLIGNTATGGLSKATLTAGTGVTITNGNGTITLATSAGTGTVTSVALSGGTTGLTVSGSPVTTSGTITLAGTLAVANGGTGSTTASTARTALGSTTVGDSFYTLTNPSAITFPRINADNTVTALSATNFRTAIGAGTGNGDVTGPSSSTDNAFVRFDLTTGKLLQNSTGATLDDAGAATFTGSVNVAGTSATGADIKLYEDTDNGTNYVSFKAPSTIAANITWTLPNADGTNGQVLTTNGSGTLSWGSAGSSMVYPGAGIAVSTGSAWTTSLTAPAGDLVGTTATQTLTNKTLTSPKVGTAILDQNGNEVFAITATVSAVNEFTVTNATTGNSPSITASGGDTNISINLIPKGSGTVQANSVPVVTTTGTQTLTNKTLTTPVISSISNTGTLTLPTSTDTLVGRATTDTLTNKTIEAGTFTNGYTEETATANTGTAYTIDLANGSLQILTLTGNCTFTFPTATSGRSFMLLLKQDGTGSRTVTWPAAVKWPGGSTPTITATANKGDKFIFTADGTNWYGSVGGQNYTTT